ncbi:uncharacterized protein [Parasteatoda tepidariorum]|uniref:uncharacterized protein n=1 Tax=Parasteatoda tepidariorum TaxID=114398 RepID=UPI0039BCE74B
MRIPCHYLPIRPVIKERSTTKIRPVFNASSKRKGVPSLNDSVEKGNFLRFLWYGEDGQVKHFRHRRVVFGVSCSPFLVGATIQYHLNNKLEEAIGGNEKYPKEIIQELIYSFYVDNCLTSVKTESELKQFIEVATNIMDEKQFDLQGWESTNPSEPNSSETYILGMKWNRQSDTLLINIPDMKDTKHEKITKRSILAASHRVFDPMGITSPVSLLPKLWLQNLWKAKTG